jgi:hypothetical protein
MDLSLIILALETLREQVVDDKWGRIFLSEGQERLDRIDEQIDLMKSGYVRTEY